MLLEKQHDVYYRQFDKYRKAHTQKVTYSIMWWYPSSLFFCAHKKKLFFQDWNYTIQTALQLAVFK